MDTEIPVLVPCNGDTLVGIVHKPENFGKVGVVIVVAGGPQYRVGAHRQFITLARKLAKKGITTIRFDHRGTGDSTGELRGFMDMNEDIQSAIHTLCIHVPAIEHVVLWGECVSATACTFYSYTDTRVKGILLTNPWIRTEQGQAKTFLKHYYWDRLFDKSFWLKVKSGKFSVLRSLTSYFKLYQSSKSKTEVPINIEHDLVALPLPERVVKSCEHFHGKVLVVTSGKDLIAQEYKDYVEFSTAWQSMIQNGKITAYDIPDSDHTFSRETWRDALFNYTENWIIQNYK